MYINKTLIIFVVLIIHFAFSTKFINASGFNEVYSLRGGLSAVNEAGIIFYNMEKICINCQLEFETTDKKRKYCNRNCYSDYRAKNIKYAGIHKWIKRNYGKANHCKFCNGEKAKRFEWALKRGCVYEKDINNYFQLCPSCHRKYDDTLERKLKISKAMKGKPAHNKRPIVQYNLEGKVMNVFESITKAGEETGIKRMAIQQNLANRTKKTGGFIWLYQHVK